MKERQTRVKTQVVGKKIASEDNDQLGQHSEKMSLN